jgi:hypothetical protein
MVRDGATKQAKPIGTVGTQQSHDSARTQEQSPNHPLRASTHCALVSQHAQLGWLHGEILFKGDVRRA